MSNNNAPNSMFSLKSILEKEKLDNTNFMNWYRNLKIVLRVKSKDYVLEKPIPDEPAQQNGLGRRNWRNMLMILPKFLASCLHP
ncbi:hypothetical protein HanIR_Chr12g0612881 [Helianthus annuus]|nr:hypothetical protein HanIR_Chr12g0612881 [Helianthus annuus]